MINKDFFLALEDLERTKGIKKSVFIEALETALAIAYKKHTGTSKAIEVKLVPERNTIKVFAYQKVVETVEDKDAEISLEDARLLNKKYKVGDFVSEEINSKDIDRIPAQTAKQVVLQKLREIESELAFSELSQKEDELITCVVRRIDGNNVYVELNKQIEAVLMPQDQAPNDKYIIGKSTKVYVKKIKAGQRGPQVMVSRTVPGFVKRLFEIEVPEIANGLIEVKAIVREAGYRTKMAVYCEDSSIDAVGACVGNRGMRVNAIVSELGGEKIDIIPWCPDVLEFIARSLSPAKVVMVQVNDDDHVAKVVVMDDMLSLAIGKDGQNARLAARLTGWKIDVKPYSSLMQEAEEAEDEEETAAEASETAGASDAEDGGEPLADSVFDEDLGELE
ncbi:MAG: transcription termination factor NusA [Clostridiales bacterium]|jgi:N utilization substance protein A|nr:transcription termination factor NusA [Clostridiales bacterium]